MRTTSAARRRLLLVTHHYYPERGAPQRRWDALTPRLIDAGVDVSVLAPPPHYPAGRLFEDRAEYQPGRLSRGRHGERIVRTTFREHSSRLRSRSLDQAVVAWSSICLGLRIFRHPSLRPDVVVGTVPGIPSMFAAWVLARATRAKFVVEMRDAWPDLIEPAGLFRAGRTTKARVLGLARTFVHRAVSRLQARADSVVTTTETFAEVLQGRGVDDVAVVRNGTSYTPDAADLASSGLAVPTSPADPTGPAPDGGPHLLRDRPLRVAYAGTVGRAQDLGTVVRAAAEMRRRGRAVDVRIVGPGAEVESLQRLAAELGAPVTFGGPVPAEEVHALYRWADTVLVSLRDWQPLEWTVPSKLYEVMASGRLVTACVAGEAAEIVASTGAGTVVLPGDAAMLADVWSGWVRDGALPEVSPAAAAWVAANADDDELGRRYVQLVDHLMEPEQHAASAGHLAAAADGTGCPTCEIKAVPEPPERAAPSIGAVRPSGESVA
ncbi:glycosyltransferase involved in cell wall biosynthesis [Isoptericola sp. CG 20/1183]|uniref:D-inositol 3-phosphate glycosyltransferase n=1 Tax=Isoptericola halotolerans TaxID=300560 RepID=A0ABX5EFF0_9MICO|nr:MULTISPECIES: glycosyltransferase family 4 protein [Isoptericola]PRZ08086.1 glycosyltransferase involved in cell wall biosynthesis [Isoptericola halotolerans]PRZ08884.1 glycosyltransferase involved in cell wall biosynthesis [Isoptericola sp. CG 20/1183]